MSNYAIKYRLYRNVCSYKMGLRLQLESGDEQMENEQMVEKKKILKEAVDELDEETIDYLLSILHKEKRTP